MDHVLIKLLLILTYIFDLLQVFGNIERGNLLPLPVHTIVFSCIYAWYVFPLCYLVLFALRRWHWKAWV
jgi:hypothetical protein